MKHGAEVYVIVSRAAEITLKAETDFSIEYLKSMSTEFFREDDISAPISSGTFKHDGMAIVPCSIKTASSIAYGIADNLIVRAADVTLKEKRKLVLAIREAPLHLGHLKTLTALAEVGAVVFPPVVSFYTLPQSLDDLIEHIVSRIAELLGVNVEYKRWNGDDLVTNR